MSHLTVVVPSTLVSPVRDGLLTLHEIRTESSAGADPASDTSLAAVDAALAQIDAAAGLGDTSPVITVDLDVIATAVHAALLTAAERVVTSCHDFALPGGDVTPITEALDRTVQTHRLLADLRREEG